MRPVDSAAQALRALRGGIATRVLAWIEARNRTSGTIEGLGLWSGGDTQTFTLTDAWSGSLVTRPFQGAGALLSLGSIRHEAGLNVRPVSVGLSVVSPAVIEAVRVYDVRGARVQLWELTLDPETGLAAGAPEARYKGYVNKAPLPRPVPGGDASLELSLVSTARLLSIPYPRRKSDAEQQRRSGDRLRRYKASAGSIDLPWFTESR